MFLRLVLLLLCLWRLDGVFGDSVSVMKGDSVTLDSGLIELKDDDLIQWRSGNTLIAELNKRTNSFTVFHDVLDGRFRDRLKLDKQIGSLTITNTRTEHTGCYELYYKSTNLRKCFFLSVIDGPESVSVNEGDSVTINSELTELKDGDGIWWSFGYNNILIAEINKWADRFSVYDDVLDGRFRDRLKLDKQTGSLTITNTTNKHAGRYEVQMNYVRKRFNLRYNGAKSVSVYEGDSFTLDSDLTELKDDDLIQWRFGNTLIAEINKRADGFTVYDDDLDGRFRDRLKLDKQTGSLTITDMRTEHNGGYDLYYKSTKLRKYFFLSVIIVGMVPVSVKEVSVNEGDSVTLNSGLTEVDDLIQWWFGNTLIAEINKRADSFTVYDDVLDGRFRDRLKLDKQTGSLTITNTRTEHAGHYDILINSVRFYFDLTVIVSVNEGDSVTLNFNLTEVKDFDVIRWRFEHTVIAVIYKHFNIVRVYDDDLDGRFRDRLKLDNQTGSLTITNITTEHEGYYKMDTNRKKKIFILTFYDFTRCCDSIVAVIRLVSTGLVGVATAAAVFVLVYDIRSKRAGQGQARIHTSET